MLGLKKNVPVYVQSESAECGLTCLAMMLSYFGYDTDVTSLRKNVGLPEAGTSLKNLISIGSIVNLKGRALQLELEDLSNLSLPCVLHWDLNHFVVLTEVSRDKYVIHDPASGKIILTKEQVSNHFTGFALEFTPTINFKKENKREKLSVSFFIKNTFGWKRALVNIFALSFLLELFALLFPLHLQIVIDEVIPLSDFRLSEVLAIGFLLLLLIQSLFNYLREISIISISNKLNVSLTTNLFSHLLKLPLSYFYRRHIGDIVSRFQSLEQIRYLITTGIVSSFVDGFFVILTFIAMTLYSVKLSGVVLLFVAIYVLIRVVMFSKFRITSEEEITNRAKENTHFIETVRGMQTIKLFEKEEVRSSAWQNLFINVVNKQISLQTQNMYFLLSKNFLFGMQAIIIVFISTDLIVSETLTIGMVFAFVSFKLRFNHAIDKLVEQLFEFNMINLHLERVSNIALQRVDRIYSNSSDAENLNNAQGLLEVKNLSFQYSQFETSIFSGKSYIFYPGESTAIIGPSGCGKTTFLKCLLNLLEPSSGSILLDNTPVRNVKNFRSLVSSVMQDDQLLSGSILENISCFDESIDMEKVVRCSKLACIHEDIQLMPMKYNSLIGDMGSTLSGGQKQRVILARALYKEPKILILDEATSHLDPECEKIIVRNLQNMNMTRIYVAHRKESIVSADHVINFIGF